MKSPTHKLPVTVLSGSPGNNRLHISTIGRQKVVVIVNDMSEIIIDVAIVQKEISLSWSEKSYEMSNGCIVLLERTLEEVTKLAGKRFDYLAESTGFGTRPG